MILVERAMASQHPSEGFVDVKQDPREESGALDHSAAHKFDIIGEKR